jgi:hypothetical protein
LEPSTRTTVRLVTEHDHAVLPGNLARAICGPVVHDDDLEIDVLLGGQGAQAAIHPGRAVERADDDAKVSLHGIRLSFSQPECLRDPVGGGVPAVVGQPRILVGWHL